MNHDTKALLLECGAGVQMALGAIDDVLGQTRDKALQISEALAQMEDFEVLHKGYDLPVLCYTLREDPARIWTLYDLSDRLMMKGWQVPAYPLPADREDVIVQRVVCRADFSQRMCTNFLEDFRNAVAELREANVTFHAGRHDSYGYTH